MYISRHHPGMRRITSSYGIMPWIVTIRIPWFSTGSNYNFVRKYKDYKQCGVDVVSQVTSGLARTSSSHAYMLRQVSTHPLKAVFHVSDPIALKVRHVVLIRNFMCPLLRIALAVRKSLLRVLAFPNLSKTMRAYRCMARTFSRPSTTNGSGSGASVRQVSRRYARIVFSENRSDQ